LESKVNGEFWTEILHDAGSDSFIEIDSENKPDVKNSQVSITPFPAELIAKIEKISLGKDYNKYLFFVATLYIWLNRLSRNKSKQLIVTSAFDLIDFKSQDNLIFLFLDSSETDTVKTLLKKLHDNLQQNASRTNYDFASLLKRILIDKNDHSQRYLFRHGLVFNKINHIPSALGEVNMLFSIDQNDSYCQLKITVQSQDRRNPDIHQIPIQFLTILDRIASEITLSVKSLDIVPIVDKMVMNNVNKNVLNYENVHTILYYFDRVEKSTPDRIAVILDNQSYTYHEIKQLSCKLAALIHERYTISDGDIVGIMIGHNIWRIVGIMGVLRAGAAYVPIKSDFPVNRINFMLKDCNCKVLISEKEFQSITNNLEIDKVLFVSHTLIAGLDLIREDVAVITNATPFVILYTSGSSGKPKGVIIDHGNMLDRLLGEVKLYSLDDSVCTIQTSNYAFDSSLLDLFLPFITGGKIVIPAEENLLNYEMLASLIYVHYVTDLQVNPNFLKAFLDACIPQYKKIERSLKRIWSGGESLNSKLVDSVVNHLEGVMISNHYGPTEATIDSLVYKDVKTFENNIIGKPIFNMKVFIMDTFSNIQPLCFDGEICLSGKGVTRGYINLPILTSERFIQNPFDNGELLYKTGDLGRMLPDGNIEYRGRIDNQIKIRGYRIEIEEVEKGLLGYPSVQKANVISKTEQDGTKFLVAFIVHDVTFCLDDFKKFLSLELPQFMIPAYFVTLKEMPVTNTGKIDKSALQILPHDNTHNSRGYVAPRNDMEGTLCDIWVQILNRNVIGTSDNFFEIGGHSLKATQLISKIYQFFKVKIGLKDVFDYPTIGLLSKIVQQRRTQHSIAIPVVEKRSFYDASGAQKRIWLISQDLDMSHAYNLPDGYWLKGKVNPEFFRKAFLSTCNGHESFRTTFFLNFDGLKQKIHDLIPNQESVFDYYDIEELSQISQEQFVNEHAKVLLGHHFSLEKGPLLKAELIRISESANLFIFSMHHIIADEWSIELFFEEFLDNYKILVNSESIRIPQNRIQYKDYSLWRIKNSKAFDPQEYFWLNLLGGDLPYLALPTDHKRLLKNSIEAKLWKKLDVDTSIEVSEFAASNDVTIFITLFSIFNVLLSKVSGQEDIIIGTVVSGRTNPEIANTLGVFVNTLAIRSKPTSDKSFRFFLAESKSILLNAFANQDCEFESLVKKLNVKRAPDQHPLFNILFEFQNLVEHKSEYFSIASFEYSHKPFAKFDITVTITQEQENISVGWAYRADLFDSSTIEGLSTGFEATIKILLKQPEVELGKVDLLSVLHFDDVGMHKQEHAENVENPALLFKF